MSMQFVVTLFIIVLLMGCNGGKASAPWPKERSSPAKTVDSSHQQEPTNEARKFKDIQGGRGKTKGGIPFSYHLYKSSDDVAVSTTVENHRTAVSADKALQRKIKTAIKIIERGLKVDAKGQRTGERVVALFATDDSEKEHAAVIWTEGSQFYQIESSSLQDVLEFEKSFYR